jgi:hypothetical protein
VPPKPPVIVDNQPEKTNGQDRQPTEKPPVPVTTDPPQPAPPEAPKDNGGGKTEQPKSQPKEVEPQDKSTQSTDAQPSKSPSETPPKPSPNGSQRVVTPAPPQPPPESPEERKRRLFAGLTEVSLQINPFDRNPQNQVNQMLMSAPRETIERGGIRITDTTQAVFHVNLESKMAGDFVEMTLTGEVVVRDNDGTQVKIWEKREQVLQARRSLSTSTVFRILRENVQKFFVAFVADFNSAKSSS